MSRCGKRYYLGSNGKPVKGWHRIKHYKTKKKKWCYFDKKGVFRKSISKNTRNKWVKAGGYRIIYFGDEVCDALENYLELRETIIPLEGSEDALLVSHDRLVHLHLGNHLHVALTVLVEGPVGCDCVFLDGQCKRVHQFLVVLQVEHIVVGADVDVLGNGDVEGDGLLWVECVHGALLNGHPVGHALDGVVTLSAAVVIDVNREGVVFLLLCIDINGFLRFSPSHGVAVDES